MDDEGDGAPEAFPDFRYRGALVEWEDSQQPVPEWQWGDAVKASTAMTCMSLGFIVAENERVVVLAQNVGDFSHDRCQVSGVIRIPRRAVIRIIDL